MKRSDRWLILTAYLLLVGVVAFGAWWLQKTEAEARKQRCEVANLDVSLALISTLSIPEENLDLFDPELIPMFYENASKAAADICEGTGIEPSAITPGEEKSE